MNSATWAMRWRNAVAISEPTLRCIPRPRDLPPRKKSGKGTSITRSAESAIRERYENDPQTDGLLLYIKSSLTGDEPSDIFSARNVDTKFPARHHPRTSFSMKPSSKPTALSANTCSTRVWSDYCTATGDRNPHASCRGSDPRLQVGKLYNSCARNSMHSKRQKMGSATGNHPST